MRPEGLFHGELDSRYDLCMNLSNASIRLALLISLAPALGFGADSVPPDPTLAGLPGFAWDGKFELTLFGVHHEPIPIRFVTAPFDARARLPYHFAVQGAADELATVINAIEPSDDRTCTDDPALSSVRYAELHSDGVPNVYHGKVWVSRLKKNSKTGACEPTERDIPIVRFEVQPGSPRKLEILIEVRIAQVRVASVVYHFTEAVPQPADWKSWLKAINP